MNFQPRDEFLNARLIALLDRLAPPMSIKSNPDAQRDEVAGMMRAVNRSAPTRDYAEWWGRFEDALRGRMKTRAWPTPNEISEAARAITHSGGSTDGGDTNRFEPAAVDRMASWFDKFKSQLPGHGKPHRTAELIRRGVLRNEAEARFYGFDLSSEQRATSMNQRECDGETQHHDRIRLNLRAITESQAAYAGEVAAARKIVKPDDFA